MKFKRLTAALIAAATASTPLSFNASAPISYAEKTNGIAPPPEWLPSDFDSALEFRNTYGAIHIEDGLICAVFQEQAETVPEGEPRGVLRYDVNTTKGMTQCMKHDIFASKDGAFNYEVIVYKPIIPGEFEISFLDTWVNVNGKKKYTFSIDDSLNAVETDIYSWLPDCFEEYRNYFLTGRKVFTKDNYLVFCFDSTAGTAFDWYPTPSNDYDRSVIDYVMTEYCNEETTELLDGGEQHRIEVYQAKKDGMAKISYDYVANYGKPYLPEEVEKTMVADCAIINNAQNILLPGNMRVTVIDYDTGKPLTIAENSMLSVWTDIRYYTPEGDMSTGPIYEIETNPTIINEIWNFSKADHFGFRLGDYGIPEGYATPDDKGFVVYSKGSILPDYMTVTEYENGSADVVFKLKKNSDVDFSYNAHSLFSDEIVFNWADSNAVKAADSQSAQISSSKELSEFLKKYLSEQAITPYLKKYDDKFFEENVLLLYTYIDPYHGRIYDHEFAGAALDGNNLKISFTSSVGHAVCKTYHFEVMQAVIPKAKFNNYTAEWNPIEVFDKDLIKITFVDADTGELLKFDEIPLDVTIGYLGEDGVIAYGDTELTAYMNPYFCGINYQDADVFELGLFEKSLPKGYKLADDYKKITKFDNGSADVVFKLKFTPTGDVNDDGEFNVADVVLFQKWLLGSADTKLANWKVADFINDNVLDIFDLCLMRKALIQTTNLPVAVSITETGGYAGVHRVWKVYKDNEKYILSYDDQKGYVNTEPILVEISEADYNEIMSMNYDWIIDEYNKTPREQVWDGFNYKTVLTYGNGEKTETSADMTSILMKLEKLLDKYLSSTIFVEPDKRTTNGSPLRVMVDDLKLYSGPNESYKAITLIPEGARLYELGYQYDNDKWLFTQYKGQYGWIKTIEDDNSTVTLYFEQYVDKPVIYLYPEQETDVHVELELTEAELSTTYPKYNNGWNVTAYPDGKLINKADGTHHRYLFWDAVNCRTRFDFSKGFCVAGSDTERFLKEKLTYMGLTEEEMNEFIVYWLPLMEHNKYNLISFQSDVYTDSAKLNITPTPDSMLRVFMAYVTLDNAIDIEPQQLNTFERKGFTVVEWGGSKVQ